MTYEIKYKVYLYSGGLSDWLRAKIKYRLVTDRRWKRLDQAICEVNIQDLREFNEKINGKFGGSMDAYIQKEVEGVLYCENLLTKIDDEKESLLSKFFTHGWKTMIAVIPDKTQEE